MSDLEKEIYEESVGNNPSDIDELLSKESLQNCGAVDEEDGGAVDEEESGAVDEEEGGDLDEEASSFKELDKLRRKSYALTARLCELEEENLNLRKSDQDNTEVLIRNKNEDYKNYIASLEDDLKRSYKEHSDSDGIDIEKLAEAQTRILSELSRVQTEYSNFQRSFLESSERNHSANKEAGLITQTQAKILNSWDLDHPELNQDPELRNLMFRYIQSTAIDLIRQGNGAYIGTPEYLSVLDSKIKEGKAYLQEIYLKDKSSVPSINYKGAVAPALSNTPYNSRISKRTLSQPKVELSGDDLEAIRQLRESGYNVDEKKYTRNAIKNTTLKG